MKLVQLMLVATTFLPACVAETRVISLGKASPEARVAISADCRHVAVVEDEPMFILGPGDQNTLLSGAGASGIHIADALYVDGQLRSRESRFAEVKLSPDGSRVAYAAFRNSKSLLLGGTLSIVVDGAGHDYDLPRVDAMIPWFLGLRFSADSKRVAWAVTQPGDREAGGLASFNQLVFVDGQLKDCFPLDFPVTTMTFSPDGQRFAWTRPVRLSKDPTQDGVKWMIDGYQGLVHAGVIGPMHFSADSKRTAYFASEADHFHSVVIDGTQEIPSLMGDAGAIAFSPDGQEIAYSLSERVPFAPYESYYKQWLTIDRPGNAGTISVIDSARQEQAQPGVSGLTYSADGKHLAYIKAWRAADRADPRKYVCLTMLHLDDADLLNTLRVTAEEDVHPAAESTEDDTARLPAPRCFLPLMPPVFSPDSKHLAYAALRDGKWTVYLDNVAAEWPLLPATDALAALSALRSPGYLPLAGGSLPYAFDSSGALHYVTEKQGELRQVVINPR